MTLPKLKIGHLTSHLPIIQGGMGVGISMSGLASAVANAGGIGVIAGAMIGINEADVSKNGLEANSRALTREIRKAKNMTNGIIGVNLMVSLNYYQEMVETAISEKADIIFVGAGLPMNLPSFLSQGDKTCLVPIVSSGRAAALICKRWHQRYNYLPDAIVVEGPKAGGHLGFKMNQIDDPSFCLESLVSDVVTHVTKVESKYDVSIPVIAAGGIYDGEDIKHFIKLGAKAVQMGTRFVATYECDADPNFKISYVNACEEDIMVIKSPVGLPGRVLRNQFLINVNFGAKHHFRCPYNCIKTCDPDNSPYCLAMVLASAKRGNFNNGFAFAGANVFRINNIVSVKELMNSLEAEYELAST